MSSTNSDRIKLRHFITGYDDFLSCLPWLPIYEKKNQIAHFSFQHKKLCNHRDKVWQVTYHLKAHGPKKVRIIFLRPHRQRELP